MEKLGIDVSTAAHKISISSIIFTKPATFGTVFRSSQL
jgi:hypothetical protein